MSDKITSSYLHRLQGHYHNIGNRGICIDKDALDAFAIFVDQEILSNLAIASSQWNCHVFVGAAMAFPKSDIRSAGQVNINATQGEKALLTKLKNLGYKIPTVTKKDSEGNYEQKFSTGELTLQKMLVTNQFNFPGGDPAIRAILAIRELQKLKTSYINARLYRSQGQLLYLSNYNVVGTLTGRRSSRKHTFGYGNNAQNFPKHGKLSKLYRRCLISRPGRIFLAVDQKSAEEWPVAALSANTTAILEMQNGVNRHIRRAARLFGVSENSRTESEWKEHIEYYLGKKCGHANNYGMQPIRLSDSLAQEGYSIPVTTCKLLLDKLNNLEPQIRGVFHAYVKDQISSTRILPTPFGRERQFLGLRPNDNNYKIFNEAFAYIPQSVVGDNTGFAVDYLETELQPYERCIIQEGHDSIVQDVLGSRDLIYYFLEQTQKAFDRQITFHNGITIQIPIEAELGYNMADMVKIKDFSYTGVAEALKLCNEKRHTCVA